METIVNGIDLVDFPRIEEMVEKHGNRFLDRIFTANEQAYATSNRNSTEKLAGRFAAKEACSKALGTGMRLGVTWRHMAISHEPSGKPVLHLSGSALKKAKDMGANTWHVSLSHEGEYATAVVIMSG